MQPLIVLASILSVTSGAQLSPLPYAYLVDPLPVYHQSQDTRTGEHAYSYSGGPSAKEEVKGPDGVTRGSYSYVDAHGILQSVFYVADENGFRVAATNLPTDADLPQPEAAKVEDDGESVDASSPVTRKRRSLDLAGPILLPEFAPTATSQQSRFQVHKSVRIEAPVERQDIENPAYVHSELAPKDLEKQQVSVVVASAEPVYSPVVSHVPLATSHQSRFQIHNNIRLEAPDLQDISSPVYVEQVPNDFINIAEQKADAKIETSQPISSQEESRLQVPSTISQQSQVGVGTELEEPAKVLIENAPVQLNQPLYQSIPYSVPLATSHQSRYQIHKSVRIEDPEVPALELNEHAVPAENYVEQVPVLGYPAYHESRIALHRALGLEGPGAKNAIKIHQAPVAAVAPAVATIVEESIPVHAPSVVTAYSNQRRIQVHRNNRIELEQPLLREVVAEQHVPLAVPSVLATAYSNQRRTQVHQNNKIELEQPALATFDKLDALYAH